MTWMNPTCKPTDHHIFQEYNKLVYCDMLVKLAKDTSSFMSELGAVDETEILEKLGPYLIDMVQKGNQDIIDAAFAKRTDAQKFTVSCTYEGSMYLKKMMDTLMADKELLKYKEVLLKSFGEITSFPKFVVVDTNYIIYDADLILGSKTIADSQRLAGFMDILFDNLKTVVKTETLSTLTNPTLDTDGAFKMVDASFDMLKKASQSDTNLLISNLKTLFEDTQYANHISIIADGNAKVILPSEVSNVFEAQFESSALYNETNNLFSHINFS